MNLLSKDHETFKVIMIYQTNPLVSYSMGGGKRYVQSLIKEYLRRGIQITFLGAKTRMKPDIKENKNLRFIPLIKSDTKWVIFLAKLFIKIALLDTTIYNVFHIHRSYFALPFLFFKKKSPLVCTIHGVHLNKMKVKHPVISKLLRPFFEKIERLCFKRITYVVFVNKKDFETYKTKYPELNLENKSSVLPTGVDLNIFKPLNKKSLRKKMGIYDEEVILFVGRLDKIKNIDFIINSFKNIKKKRRKAKLYIVGKGPEKNKLKFLVSKLKLDNEVLFLGEVNHEKLPEIMNISDVLVLSSYFESSPTVVKESLSCGLPVVTLETGDVNLWITNELLGSIVKERNENKFAEAVVKHLEKKVPNHIIYEKVYPKLLKISWENISVEYISLYDKLISGL